MGPYELLFQIASGGVAEVFAARRRGSDGDDGLVAIKRLREPLTGDATLVARLLEEARLTSAIRSPHVVSTLDVGRDASGAVFLVLELVEGVALSEVMREAARARGVVPLGVAVELIAQAAAGLHAAHEASERGAPLHVVHRDVSPQNILAGVDGRTRITDFGSASVLSRDGATPGPGKRAYAAPEQLGAEVLDRRADIFSLGVVAWELFAGQRLFANSLEERIPTVDLRAARPSVPARLAAVISRALEEAPERRWSSAAALGAALRREAEAAEVALPDAHELGRFVAAAGGAALRERRARLRDAHR